MNPNDSALISELRRDEGVRRSIYLDSVGIKTIGVGHNIAAHPLPDGFIPPLTDEQIDGLLASDLLLVFSGLDAHIGWWRTLSYARQRVLANMAFNLGINGLLGFKNTLQKIKDGDYDGAATGMLSSKWAGQVGDRAKRLAKMMREG